MRKERNFSLKKFLVSQLFIIIGLFVLIFIFVALSKEFLRSYQVNNELEELQNQIIEMEQKNQQFSEIIDYLKTSDFAEKEARKRFNLKKPGESVVVIETEQNSVVQPNPLLEQNNLEEGTNNIEEQNVSNPKKWWSYFFGNAS